MSTNTGLLTARCDPFGAESQIKLLGGIYPESMKGRYNWFCSEPAQGRYRMICTGGDYGERIAPDKGLVAAYHCDGGHQGQVMTLCKIHARQFSVGPRAPGWNRDRTQSHGIVGGTDPRGLCPACAYPPEARELSEKASYLQQAISQAMSLGIIGMSAKLEVQLRPVQERMTELYHTGRVHRCPLILREVS